MNKRALFICVSLLLVFSCEKEETILDNPIDPENPEYIPPIVIILSGPTEGEVVDTPSVSFQWEGNELVSAYRYRFDSVDWSDWSQATSLTFDYLDEDEYNFSVQSQYPSGDTSEVASVSFTVDAVKGPALMFFPRRHIALQGSTVIFQILAEEVSNLTAAEFSISFDPNFLEIVSVSQGSIFQMQGESIFHDEYDNQSGSLSILTAILGGAEPSVSGTGDLVLLEVRAKGTATINFNGAEVFKDSENNNISILETVGGFVTQ